MIFESFMTFLGKVLFFSGMVSGEKSSFPKPLTKDAEAEHFRLFKTEGNAESKEILIRHNLRLVAHVVKKYNGAAEADDLISCGTIGLIKAINSFDPTKGAQISTYAARCIENEILMFLRVSKKHQKVGSLNESFGTEKDGSELVLADIIADESDDPKEIELHNQMMQRLVGEMQKRLSEREFTIIKLRYGIGSDKCLPQREVAEMLGISRSYISRIEKHAIDLVRQIVSEPTFRGFYEEEV
ncbi:MAG: sigma-70 family RNA polymerase sigma factor [Firmicutes bacterium]|nr:sigma-70 family RNA polymerase sigma factor [Bacillota bacterium]